MTRPTAVVARQGAPICEEASETVALTLAAHERKSSGDLGEEL